MSAREEAEKLWDKDALASRFWAQVKKSEGAGCWEWQGTTDGRYGQISIQDRGVKAHRAAWFLEFGPIPKGKLICHHCDNTLCVRPDHLFVGTMSDNILDAVRKGRVSPPDGSSSSNRRRAQTHCKRGHPLDEQNARLDARGYRQCRACQAIHRRKHSARAALTPTEQPAPTERVCKHCWATATALGPIGMWQHCPKHEDGALQHEWPAPASQEER